MKLLLGIGTYRRIAKLERLLKSLENQTYDNFIIHVVCDNNDFETEKYLKNTKEYKFGHLAVSVNNEHKFIIGAWNYCVSNYVNTFADFDGFVGLCDDVELYPNALEEAVKCHKENFPDTDGVVGFKQVCKGHENYTYKPFGQMLIGKQWIERYKEVNYTYYAPMYKHFYADEELFIYASSLNKFILCEKAILNHDHPLFTGNIDITHQIIRQGQNSPKNYDIALFKQRQKKNLIWGKSWEL